MSRIKLIKQLENKDCGAACLSMILQSYGKKVPLATVSEAIKVDQHGASVYGLLDGAKQFGLSGTALEGTSEEFFEGVKSGEIHLPVIARILNSAGFEHFIVVTAIRRGRVHYCDPGMGRIAVSCSDFTNVFLGHVICYEKTKEFKKGNERKGAIMDFVKLITRQKGLVAVIGVLSALVTAVSMVGSFLFQLLIDNVLPGVEHGHDHAHESELLGGIELFAVLLTAVCALYVLRFLVQLLRGKLLTVMTKRINLPLMLGYYDKVVDLKMDFFGNHKTGDVISRFSDAGKVEDALANVTLTLMIDVPMVLFCGILLYKQSVDLFWVVASILVLYALISLLYIRPLDRKNRQTMVENGKLNSYLKESIDGIQTIKAFNAEGTVKSRTKELLTNLQKHGMKAAMLSMGKDTLIELMTSVGTLILLWVGAVNVVSGDMTLGVLMTFYTLLGYFLSPIQNVIELQPKLQSAVVAAARMRDILDRKGEEPESGERTKSFNQGDITLEGVDFRYGNRSLTLKNLNMTIPQGKHTALVGASGCGKTTVTKLLMGFYEPEKGSIKIGGSSLHGIKLTDLRDNIAYVPQETFLFSDTVHNNLFLNNEDELPREWVDVVLDACGCDFIKELPFGEETMLEENGNNLSGGQRQRLAIARALLKNPQILILDEATSNLDATSERKLLDSLRILNPNMTVIMVAHRLNSVRNCDHIMVLDKGSLAEEGLHTHLLEQNGLYAKLYNAMN